MKLQLILNKHMANPKEHQNTMVWPKQVPLSNRCISENNLKHVKNTYPDLVGILPLHQFASINMC